MGKPPEIIRDYLEKEKDKMFRIAWKMCGNPEDAEEVLQETALKALKNWDQFRGDSQISTWLYRIASNTCLSKQRKKAVQTVEPEFFENLSGAHFEDTLRNTVDWSTDPLTQTLNDELRKTLDKAILKLPELYRMVFLMRDIEGLSGDQTAKALGISVSNVKVRLHRARSFLRDELSGYITSRKKDKK